MNLRIYIVLCVCSIEQYLLKVFYIVLLCLIVNAELQKNTTASVRVVMRDMEFKWSRFSIREYRIKCMPRTLNMHTMCQNITKMKIKRGRTADISYPRNRLRVKRKNERPKVKLKNSIEGNSSLLSYEDKPKCF